MLGQAAVQLKPAVMPADQVILTGAAATSATTFALNPGLLAVDKLWGDSAFQMEATPRLAAVGSQSLQSLPVARSAHSVTDRLGVRRGVRGAPQFDALQAHRALFDSARTVTTPPVIEIPADQLLRVPTQPDVQAIDGSTSQTISNSATKDASSLVVPLDVRRDGRAQASERRSVLSSDKAVDQPGVADSSTTKTDVTAAPPVTKAVPTVVQAPVAEEVQDAEVQKASEAAAADAIVLNLELQGIIDSVLDVEALRVTELGSSPDAQDYGIVVLAAQLKRQPITDALTTLQGYVDKPYSVASPQARRDIVEALAVLGLKDSYTQQFGTTSLTAQTYLAYIATEVVSEKGKAIISMQADILSQQSAIEVDAIPAAPTKVLGRMYSGKLNEPRSIDLGLATDGFVDASASSGGSSNNSGGGGLPN